MMDTAVVKKETKLKRCIADCWKCICEELKTYRDNMSKGRKLVSLIIAHRTTLSNVSKVDIEGTELFKVDPEISSKLQYSINQELHCDEEMLGKIIDDLYTSLKKILTKMDRISSSFKSSQLSTEEMTEASETSLSFLEILEALDKFKRFLRDSHDARQYTLEYLHFTEDVDKVLVSWNSSEVLSRQEEVDFLFLPRTEAI